MAIIEIDPLAPFKVIGERFAGQGIVLPFGARGAAIKPKQLDKESEEIIYPITTIASLKVKSGIMRHQMDEGLVEQPHIDSTRWWFRLYISNVLSDGGIEGLGNLQSAIMTARKGNKRLKFTPAHLADADHPGAVYLLQQDGRGLGIEDELVWLAGVNMLRRLPIKKYMRAEDLLYNVTPRDMNHLEELLDDKEHEYNLDESQIETLEMIKEIFNEMREESKRKVLEITAQRKRHLVVYVEGGRTYDPDGFLSEPKKELSWFFSRSGDDIVVPYRMYGTREFNPPGQDPPFLRKELIPGFRHIVSMVVGEWYPSSEIWEVWKVRTEEAQRAAGGKKVKINPMDWVMANIANLDPVYVRAAEQRYYENLIDRFAPQRNRMTILSMR